MHRYYDMAYNALHAFAYSARGYVKNEHGLLGGMQMIYKRKWHFKAALDYSFHPFAIYGTPRASNRFALYTQAEYLPNDKTSFSARYHLKNHQEDSKRHPGILYNIYRHRWKLQAHYNIGILKNVSAIEYDIPEDFRKVEKMVIECYRGMVQHEQLCLCTVSV